ncbi:hypothetical protein GCM10010975_18850 [Comamonas phosphati]|nr:hypothetical protein GCM10010975_18850 [Comamonas phosphati]
MAALWACAAANGSTAEAPMAASAMALASAVADTVADARDVSDFQANVVMVILFLVRLQALILAKLQPLIKQ